MKKKLLLLLVILITLFAITGCGNKIEENNKKDSANIANDNTNTTNNDSKTTGDSLPISEIKKQYNNDLPLGLENNYVKANGREIVIRLQTSGSSQQQANGPYYIYYNIYVGNDDK